MNPLTDKVSFVPIGDGRVIEVRQPGAVKPSKNWRFSHEAYLRYAPHLTAAINNWPVETSFEVPEGTSPNTFVRCLREARYALLHFNYDVPLAERLRGFNDDVAIAMDPTGTKVWFRAKGTPGRQARATPLTIQAVKRPLYDPEQIQSLPTEEELLAMCTLIKTGRIQGPHHFRGRFAPEVIANIENRFDVAFGYDELSDVTTLI